MSTTEVKATELGTKHCPFCDEIMPLNAIQCRHCKKSLTEKPRPSPEKPKSMARLSIEDIASRTGIPTFMVRLMAKGVYSKKSIRLLLGLNREKYDKCYKLLADNGYFFDETVPFNPEAAAISRERNFFVGGVILFILLACFMWSVEVPLTAIVGLSVIVFPFLALKASLLKNLNDRQRSIVTVGVVLFVLMGIFPPWDNASRYLPEQNPPSNVLYHRFWSQTGPKYSAGYHFIISPPTVPKGLLEALRLSSESEIDVLRLVLQWLIVIAATGFSVFIWPGHGKRASPKKPDLYAGTKGIRGNSKSS